MGTENGYSKNEICKLLTKRTVLILLFLLVLNPVLGLYTMNTVMMMGIQVRTTARCMAK